MASMDPFQYKDLPQIPALMDEQHFSFWTTDHFGQSHTSQDLASRTFSFRREDIDCEELGGHGSLDMQPMQRFLRGIDPTPISAGLLHANLGRTVSFPSQQQKMYERPWPPVEYLANSSRNGSPDRNSVSGTSSHAPQNELRSPHPNYNASYDSPIDYSQVRLPYPSPEVMNDGPYPSELPIPGNSINLRALELHHEEPDTTMDDHEHIESKSDYDYEQEHTYTKAEAPGDSYTGYIQPQLVPTMAEPENYPDSGGGSHMRDAESVQPMTQSDESDSDYKPKSKTPKKRRPSTSSRGSGRHGQKRHSRKDSSASAQSSSHRVTKRSRGSHASHAVKNPSATSGADNEAPRPFPCPFAGYGCHSTFASKNEWKRHSNTQHIKLGYWRCDLCATTFDPHDSQTVYHNDFNRKDLFTQHLRRMHSAPVHARQKADYPVNEDNLIEHQKRCYRVLRSTPPQSACLFCEKRFGGPTSWEERMEHVGRHLEKDKGILKLEVGSWNRDGELEGWLLDEGLIAHDGSGGWKIGDGKPRKDSVLESSEDEESEE